MPSPILAVMEPASWYSNDQITSVKAIFQVIAQLENGDPSSFLYSSFVDGSSFKSTLKYFVDETEVKYIYVGSHGSEWQDDRLITPAGDEISAKQILGRLNNKRIRGIFLSACNSSEMAKFIAKKVPGNVWVSGYGDEVDWIQSCALELLFWQLVFRTERKEFDKRKTIKRIQQKFERYRCLLEELSFYLWMRQKNAAVDLLG